MTRWTKTKPPVTTKPSNDPHFYWNMEYHLQMDAHSGVSSEPRFFILKGNIGHLWWSNLPAGNETVLMFCSFNPHKMLAMKSPHLSTQHQPILRIKPSKCDGLCNFWPWNHLSLLLVGGFSPWKILVKSDYCSQHMEKYKKLQTTNQAGSPFFSPCRIDRARSHTRDGG